MSLSRFLLPVLLSAIVGAAPTPGGIQWGPCPTTGPVAANYAGNTSAIECGSLAVPLDWTEPDSDAIHNISLVRVPASKQPAKGAIQYNFGGPGVGAINSLVTQGALYLTLSGGEYDLVTFDPRGVSLELPFVCATSNATIAQMASTPVDLSISEREARTGWATARANTGICTYVGNGNETGEYIGTAFMARDMARVAEEVSEDGIIHYWGYSYGTTLGATIAAMFPDKVGGMILDGIQNAKQYYYEFTDLEMITLTDKVAEYMFESCAQAGPELCPLAAAASNATGKEMARDFFNFVDSITYEPIGLPGAGSIVDGYAVKSAFWSESYSFTGWKNFTTALAPVLYGSPEEREVALTAILTAGQSTAEEPAPSLAFTYAFWGIHCADRIPRTSNYNEIAPALREMYEASYMFGGLNALTQVLCAQWPWKSKEVYQGNFEAKTKAPILFMSNSLDAQTPVISARNMSAGFEGAVLLENDGVGHAAHSYPTTCQAKHVMAYWADRTLPKEGTVCAGEFGPYDGRTWPETLKALEEGVDLTKNVTISAREWLDNYYT